MGSERARVELVTWDLGDDTVYDDALKVLARYLREAGEAAFADRVAFALNNVTPSLAVDGRLLWINDCPDESELLEVLTSEKAG
ncbi:MAG: hypothetical protein MUP40_02075 [Actinobacteria bacterium]|nr:hypothetical protein [Actinomycetota bacterium]